MRYGHNAGRHGSTRPSTRASGTMPRLPRVVYRPEGNRLRGGVIARLRRLSGADKVQSGCPETLHEVGVVSVGDIGNSTGARTTRGTGSVHHQFLDQERHAAERLPLLIGLILHRCQHRIQRRIS